MTRIYTDGYGNNYKAIKPRSKLIYIMRDDAHGDGVGGKCSPDGKHFEWLWSREVWDLLEPILKDLGYKVFTVNPYNHEIGIVKRRNIATEAANNQTGLVPFLLSIHNDANTAPPSWQSNARGISVWTSRGFTNSDRASHLFLNSPEFPSEMNKRRYDVGYGKEDFESNFTVLMGRYTACLLEIGFQDNKKDIAILSTDSFKHSVVDWIVSSIESYNNHIENNRNLYFDSTGKYNGK